MVNSAGTQGFILTSNNNVGLGVATPGTKLDVYGNIRATYTASPTYYSELTDIDGNARITANGSGASLILSSTSVGGSVGTERVRVLHDGNVGVGVTSPQYRFDINGQARLVGTNGVNFGGTSGASDKTVTIHQSSANVLALTATTTTVSGELTIAGTTILTQSSPPANAAAAGTVGTIAWDADYIYVCTAANTWKRVAIATW
jgi:hypothetical protein